MIFTRIKFWIKNARDIALPQSMLPALTALMFCIGEPGFTWWLGILTVIGVGIAHLGMNLADDYFDYRRDSRLRSEISTESIRARMDKCHYIYTGQTTIEATGRAVRNYMIVAGALGSAIVVAQYFIVGLNQALAVILYAMLGLLVGISYSGGPFKLSFYGLGELVIGLMFGPLLMLGVQAGSTGVAFSWPMLALSVAIGAMVTNIIFVHSIMEVRADAAMDKMTLARLLRHRSIMLAAFCIFALVPYVVLGLGIFVFEWWSAWYLLTLLTLPMTINLLVSLYKFVYDRPRHDDPHFWMGPMGDFEAYRKAGVDWFLLRWLMARNIVTFFCIIMILVRIADLIWHLS